MIAKQTFQVSEQMAIALAGLAANTVLLVVFKELNCLS
jgi:hypothetical protein